MKKSLFILALALALVISACATAANETGGTTALTYEVTSNYMITIPTAVAISNGTGTQEVSVNANSIIPANQTLDFKIKNAENKDGDAGDKFRLKNSLDASVFLNYTITYPTSQTISDFDTVFLSATSGEAYNGKSVTLTYTPAAAQSAGNYSDSLTFSVGLANVIAP